MECPRFLTNVVPVINILLSFAHRIYTYITMKPKVCKEFSFFTPDCHISDDTILTLAICQAFLDCRGDYNRLSLQAAAQLKAFALRYPRAGYGSKFLVWMLADVSESYGSLGNGSAMRVSPCAMVARSLEEVKKFSYAVTAVTHNHPEGLKGAEAIAVAAFLAKEKRSKAEIGRYVQDHYYPMDFLIDEIRPHYHFGNTCPRTVPFAIKAFLESSSFEDTIRTAISLGGDTDTLAAMAGSIAGLYYGIPDAIAQKTQTYLDPYLSSVLRQFEETYMVI